jgi:hypothetical protein
MSDELKPIQMATLLQRILRPAMRDEEGPRAPLIDGVMHSMHLDLDELEPHRAQIQTMINRLDDTFHQHIGGGWSFLNLCHLKDGTLWGQQMDAEALVLVSVALGMCAYNLPREVWESLPGGVPYVVFNTQGVRDE